MKYFKRIFIAASVCAFVLSAAMFVSAAAGADGDSPQQRQASSGAPQTSYVVRRHLDRIGIFRNSGGEPLRVLDVRICDLPAEDQGMLECGIMVGSEEQLRLLIEDYTS